MLASKYRFHRRNQVLKVYKNGSTIRVSGAALKYRRIDQNDTIRFAVVVSKKVSKSAVVRNRIRRRVFEVVRKNFDLIPAGFEGVITVFEQDYKDMPAQQLEKHILDLLKRATAT